MWNHFEFSHLMSHLIILYFPSFEVSSAFLHGVAVGLANLAKMTAMLLVLLAKILIFIL